MTKPNVVTTMGAIIEPIVKEDFIKVNTTTPAATGPAILLGERRGEKRGAKHSSERNQRRSQKRKK